MGRSRRTSFARAGCTSQLESQDFPHVRGTARARAPSRREPSAWEKQRGCEALATVVMSGADGPRREAHPTRARKLIFDVDVPDVLAQSLTRGGELGTIAGAGRDPSAL